MTNVKLVPFELKSEYSSKRKLNEAMAEYLTVHEKVLHRGWVEYRIPTYIKHVLSDKTNYGLPEPVMDGFRQYAIVTGLLELSEAKPEDAAYGKHLIKIIPGTELNDEFDKFIIDNPNLKELYDMGPSTFFDMTPEQRASIPEWQHTYIDLMEQRIQLSILSRVACVIDAILK